MKNNYIKTKDKRTKKLNPVNQRNMKKQVNLSGEAPHDNQSVSQHVEYSPLIAFVKEMQEELHQVKTSLKNQTCTSFDAYSEPSYVYSGEYMKLFTKKEVSDILRVDERTITNYVSKGYLKPIKTPSGALRFPQ